MDYSGVAMDYWGMKDRTFRRTTAGFYSNMVSHDQPSPIYVIASVAHRLIENGHNVTLPVGYDSGILDHVTNLMGFYDKDVLVSTRQVLEFAQIGRVLLDEFPGELDPTQSAAISLLLKATGQDT